VEQRTEIAKRFGDRIRELGGRAEIPIVKNAGDFTDSLAFYEASTMF
jgi:hypothetical protein